MVKSIADFEKGYNEIAEDLDDEICELLQNIRILEQKRDDTRKDLDTAMFNRCYTMVIKVLDLHYPNVSLDMKQEKNFKKILSKMCRVKIDLKGSTECMDEEKEKTTP